MSEPIGLRERKKLRTHATISETAIALFLDRGYDDVSVAEIAAAAEVSKRTLFAYFPTKDALVLHRFADHEDEPARTVRGRAADESPLAALRRHLRGALAQRDPISGLCDLPAVVDFYRLVITTPSLRAALLGYGQRSEQHLAAALLEAAPDGPHAELTARLGATQIARILSTLAFDNQAQIAAGATADRLAPAAEAAAEHAFTLLTHGLVDYR
ncbi:TetR/AcrR family transcriptional regulator [Pseudonocardia sp. GCM10023141]|uniref:TetR/AcrR family transcriptional regulator n=1 Tax=Pseudonocardia sp. GCM10023141 TaxID=3252653 RepID=UPI003619CF0C